MNRAKAAGSCRFMIGRTKINESDTHVVVSWRTFSDAGSIPAASTNLHLVSTRCSDRAKRCGYKLPKILLYSSSVNARIVSVFTDPPPKVESMAFATAVSSGASEIAIMSYRPVVM
jgi:hypothetical protein